MLPYIAALGIGFALFALLLWLGKSTSVLSDLLFSMSSGALIVGLCQLVSNSGILASFPWGVKMLKRLFRGEARSGREETEDYRSYRASVGGHTEWLPLILISVILFVLSLAAALL